MSAAFVGDRTSHGGMSVARGERYRLQVAPAFGTIRYVNVLADYRTTGLTLDTHPLQLLRPPLRARRMRSIARSACAALRFSS